MWQQFMLSIFIKKGDLTANVLSFVVNFKLCACKLVAVIVVWDYLSSRVRIRVEKTFLSGRKYFSTNSVFFYLSYWYMKFLVTFLVKRLILEAIN